MPRKATAKKATKKTTTARKKPAATRKVTAVRKTKKTTAKKTTAKKATAKRTPAKKAAVKRTTTKKVATRKTAAKKVTAKKVTAKKAAPVALRKIPSTVSDPYSKSQILNTISEATGVSRKEVTAILESLSGLIESHVKKRGAGQFTLPGLLKIVTSRKPATKARKGINPFTGEETVFKAKPARTVVKIRPLKKLKDMVA